MGNVNMLKDLLNDGCQKRYGDAIKGQTRR